MEREKLYQLLRLGLEKGASDIHFQVGYLPLYRFHGELVELRYKVLTPQDTEEIARILIENDPLGQDLDFNERDLAFELPGEGRFRVNISRQRRYFNINTLVIPLQIKTFATSTCRGARRHSERTPRLRPRDRSDRHEVDDARHHAQRGESRRKSKIVTVEDPVEFVFTHDKSIITQRGRHRHRILPDALRAHPPRIPTSSWSARCATSRRSTRR